MSASSLPADAEVIRGYSDCLRALGDPSLVSDPSLADESLAASSNLLTMDGRAHIDRRRLVDRYLATRDRAQLRAAIAARSVAYVPATRGAHDIVRDLARPLTADFLAIVFGYGAGERAAIDPHLAGLEGILEGRDRSSAVLRADGSVVRVWSALRRCIRDPSTDSVFAYLAAAMRTSDLSQRDAIETSLVLLHGAYENPLNHLGCMAAAAASDPARFRRLASQEGPRQLASSLAAECSPVALLRRYDVSAGGRETWVDIEDANRSVPPEDRHLAFGHGRHRCPGQGLAYDLAAEFVGLLLSISDDRWASAVVNWRESAVVNGPTEILVPEATR